MFVGHEELQGGAAILEPGDGMLDSEFAGGESFEEELEEKRWGALALAADARSRGADDEDEEDEEEDGEEDGAEDEEEDELDDDEEFEDDDVDDDDDFEDDDFDDDDDDE